MEQAPGIDHSLSWAPHACTLLLGAVIMLLTFSDICTHSQLNIPRFSWQPLMFHSWSQNNMPSQQSHCARFTIQGNHQQATCASMLQVLECSPSRVETGKRAVDWDAGQKCIPPCNVQGRCYRCFLALFLSSCCSTQLSDSLSSLFRSHNVRYYQEFSACCGGNEAYRPCPREPSFNPESSALTHNKKNPCFFHLILYFLHRFTLHVISWIIIVMRDNLQDIELTF